ncbi:MAG: ABC transporter permease [Eubacteriales bacterium]|nr:ABC transporter permease [Eubacteriales bacterium]
MKTFSDVYQTLRRKNRGQYALLSACLFFSVLLISAYASVMRSPMVMSTLPEGGDSRKQVMMIFVLAVIGCGVFSLYAATLFFRQKSRDTGIFLALGASRRLVERQLMRELVLLSTVSCVAGIVLSFPVVYVIWQAFRLFIVDTAEMRLTFNLQALVIPIVFAAVMVGILILLGYRSIRRVNIIDIIHESHKSEPIHAVPRWYGPVGIVLMIGGGLFGYLTPSFAVLFLHWYMPEGLSAVFYLPALIGMYMILLHTVVNGWRRKRHGYRDLIATSQMKFQGRQTVQNLLIMSLLIAGAYFGTFYIPSTMIGALRSYDAREIDYLYHFRNDQDIPQENKVRQMADDYAVTITDWEQTEMIRLAVDGTEGIETDNGAMGVTYETVYFNPVQSNLFLSASSYTALTGQDVELPRGTLGAIYTAGGEDKYAFNEPPTVVTNMLSGKTLTITNVRQLTNDALVGHYVMNDIDYDEMRVGLTDEWIEKLCAFNVENCDETYDFGKALLYDIIDHSGSEVEIVDAWDPVRKRIAESRGEAYVMDPEHLAENHLSVIDYDQRDSSAFRLYWQYMPSFRVVDKADFIKTLAVFLMLFLFIAIVCFAAVFIIAFTRSMTLAITGKRLYDDLRHLGASNAYLYSTVRSQLRRVFLTPAVIGTGLISAFYTMILYFNDNQLSVDELLGMLACAAIIVAISALFYAFYRMTLKRACATLDIRTK